MQRPELAFTAEERREFEATGRTARQLDARPAPYRLTELGHARRVIDESGQDFRFCRELGFLHWTGTHWEEDKTGGIHRAVKAAGRGFLADAAREPSDDRRKALAAFGAKAEGERHVAHVVEHLKTEAEMVIRPEALDTDPWALNVQNGTLHLGTGELRPHERRDFITRLAPTVFDPAAKCPRFERFMGEVFSADLGLIDCVQRSIGYAATGSTQEQCFFILHGSGANGKSTLIRIAAGILGPYSRRTSIETLTVGRPRGGGAASPDVARLRGARMVYCSEAAEGHRLNESLLKDLSGGEPVPARHLFREEFQFTPQCKILLSTNHRPRIRGTDWAVWRRVRLVPFEVTIPQDQQNGQLVDELLDEERSGILNWILAGAMRWAEGGLAVADRVQAATAEYRESQDTLAAFLADRCDASEETPTVEASELYREYRAWCETNGERPQSARGFGLKLNDRGFARERHAVTRRTMYRGIQLSRTAP